MPDPEPSGAEARASGALFALKDREQFMVADAWGDIGGGNDGLFRDDTRVLSTFRLRIGGGAPALLSSGVSHDNVVFRAHLTNRPLPVPGGHHAPEGVIHIERCRFLWDARLYERLTLTSYGSVEVTLPLAFRYAADFADIFEVRGHVRATRGSSLPPRITPFGVQLSYEGLDGVLRTTSLGFSILPERITEETVEFGLVLAPHQRLELHLEIGPEASANPSRARYRRAAACARVAMRRRLRRGASVRAPGGPFRSWLDKARSDLALLTTELPTGPYPFAGIPWFSTPFGRDGIITALQMLWLDPTLARGVLHFLAATQAESFVPERDAEPGKILHETRRGEMAALGEVPFGRYYGGVDSTPLFLMLASAYARRTADDRLIDELWPRLLGAMRWIDARAGRNPEGLLDYERARRTGLQNQGWKDSSDSIFHADGSPPEGPVALVEVQGYVYAARQGMAMLAERRGEHALADRWREQAERLRVCVESRYWMPDHGFYSIALDGGGRACRVLASNAGQLLYSGLPAPERAARVAERLLAAEFNDGWGLRSLAHGQACYNPMSYHNGSVWPHDTALCAAGLARYGNRQAAAQLVGELFDAAAGFGGRLPELYCGFRKRPGEPPVGYPVACLPQAWAAGAAFMALQACLGISIDGWNGTIDINRPELPAAAERLVVRDLPVAGTRVSLLFERVGDRVGVAPVGVIPDSVRILVRA